MIAPATSSPIAGAELEAVAAAAGREVQPLVPVDRAEQRVPVGRHVVEADPAADGPHAREARQPVATTRSRTSCLERVRRPSRRRRPDRPSRTPSGSRGRRGRGRRRTRAPGACRPGRPATRPRTGPPARARSSKTTSCSRVTSSGSSSPIPCASSTDHGPAASTTLSHSMSSPPTRTPRTRAARDLDRLDRRALERPRAGAARGLDVGARRRDRVGRSPSRARRARTRSRPPRRPAGTRAGRRPRRCRRPPPPASSEFSAAAARRLGVDEEEPAAARVDRVAVEVQRQLAKPLARADGHAHDLGVRVVAAHDRRGLAGRGLAEAAGLEQQRLHALARELPQRRRAEDPAADHDRLGAVHLTDSIVL